MITFIRENQKQLLLLLCSVIILYAFGVNGPLLWDDMDWIVNNPFVHSFTWHNIVSIFTQNILAGINGLSNYYRPLLLVSFIPNYFISGTNPFLYHVINDIIHFINGVLIYYLVLRWFKHKRVAFIASLLFLIHPLQTEAVAYVVGRGDPMSAFFILIGIILFIRKRIWLSLFAAVLAILSRETGILFPIYLGVILISFEYTGTLWERFKVAFIKTLPFIGISAVYGILRLTVLNFQNTLNFSNNADIYTEHVLYRIYTFFDALSLYLRLILWPTGLHFSHDIPVSVTFWEGFVWLGALIIIACVVWLFWSYRNKNKKPFYIWFFGLGIFFGNLSLSSGIVASINARALEHWLYFSLFGAFTVAAWYIDILLRYLENNKPKLRTGFLILSITYCIFLGNQTIQRNLTWADEVLFFKNILKYEPNNYRALNNLGNWYYEQRDSDKAVLYWSKAIVANPRDPTAYANLGYVANDEGFLVESEIYYKKAIEVDPYYTNAYRNLTALYIQNGMFSYANQVVDELQKKYPNTDFSSIREDVKKSEEEASSTLRTNP